MIEPTRLASRGRANCEDAHTIAPPAGASPAIPQESTHLSERLCNTGKEARIFHIERRGSASVIHTSRVLDLVTRDSFKRILSTAIRGNTDDVVIDLEGCAYVDSTALNVLVAMSNRGGRRLSVVIPPGNKCRRIFDICGLGDVLNIKTSIDEALAEATP